MNFRAAVAAVSVLALTVAVTDAAFAACTRLSFSVNDYGKDGPAKDAKELLEKYAQKWTGDRGIKKYSVGQKDVTCELFLNFVVFDEHTCTATANVCWEGSAQAPLKEAKAGDGETPFVNKASASKAAKAKAAAPVATGSVKPAAAAKAAAEPAAPAAAPAAPAPAAPAPAAN